MRETIEFLRELRDNNVKSWFDAQRPRYQEVRSQITALAEGLIDGIGSFDASVRGLQVKECTYRINRDIRFSPDKSPYKTWQGIFIAPRGKCSGYAGYYLHLEPDACCLTSGIYQPEPVILQSLRDEILDNGAEIEQALKEAKGFRVNTSSQLKRTPKGFPAGTEHDDWLRLRSFYIEHPLPEAWLDLPVEGLLRKVVPLFRTTFRFVEIQNRAVRFAYEEMM